MKKVQKKILTEHIKSEMGGLFQYNYTLDDFFSDILKSKDFLEDFKLFEIIAELIYKEGVWE